MSSASCSARCIRWLGEPSRPGGRFVLSPDLTMNRIPSVAPPQLAAGFYGLTTDDPFVADPASEPGVRRHRFSRLLVLDQVLHDEEDLPDAEGGRGDPQPAAEGDPDVVGLGAPDDLVHDRHRPEVEAVAEGEAAPAGVGDADRLAEQGLERLAAEREG